MKFILQRFRKFSVVSLVAVLSFCSCSSLNRSVGKNQKVSSKESKKYSDLSVVEMKKIRPNELGRIMILEYHDIDPGGGQYRRSAEDFKRDLERLYRSGFRPVSLKDYLDGRFSIKPGFSPFVLTFDDSTPGQFRYVRKGSSVETDPNCAVGILKSFRAKHPDFSLKATFFVLYGCDSIHRLFAQQDFALEKLRKIVSDGMDIGNHTYSHGFLDKLDTATALREIARSCEKLREIVPGYETDVLALPGGGYPENIGILKSGKYKTTSYRNRAALMAWGGPAFSPFSKKYNSYKILRVLVLDRELDYWLKYFAEHPEKRFISDGNPDTVAVPRSLASYLNPKAMKGRSLKVY